MRSVFYAVGLVALVWAGESAAQTKGCVYQFSDGSQECNPSQMGADCSRVQGMSINGKQVVRGYQVNRCEGRDGLGGRLHQPNRDSDGTIVCPPGQSPMECLQGGSRARR